MFSVLLSVSLNSSLLVSKSVNNGDLLIVLLKSPRPGFVKTRLAGRIGAKPACEVYRNLASVILERLKPYPNVELRISPDDAAASHSDWLLRDCWRCQGQGVGDLGSRLTRAFGESFAAGWRKVMAIGSDCPYVEPNHLRKGFEQLISASVVLGPALDGGYWLIGMNRYLPSLFEGISWGGAKVLEQTLQRTAALGAQAAMLETLEDVDDWESWQRYLKTKLKTKRETNARARCLPRIPIL